MPDSDSSPTLPRVDSHLPGPGEVWRSRGGAVLVAERTATEVSYDITTPSGVLRWKSALVDFMAHYEREVSADTLTTEQIRWTFVHCSDVEIANACRIALGLWKRGAETVELARVKVAAAFNVRRAEIGGAP